MDYDFPETVNTGDFVTCSSDRDSFYSLTRTLNDAGRLVDSLVTPKSFIRFYSIIGRTSNNSGSRFATHWIIANQRPSSRWGGRYEHVSMERYPNVNLFQIHNSNGIQFFVTYIFLGRDTIDKNYLTSRELAVLVSAINYAKFYGLHPDFTPMEVYSDGDDVGNGFANYGSYLQGRHEFEGQVNRNESASSNKTNAINDFSPSYGRLFVKTIFQALKGFWMDMDRMCSVGRDGLEEDQLVRPWDVKFHTIGTVTFTKEEFITLAKVLYTKGALLAQHPGTKSHFQYTDEQSNTVLPVYNAERSGDHMSKMFKEHNDCVGKVMDPECFMEDAEGAERNGHILKHPHDKMVPRIMDPGKLLKFYDCGFELKPQHMTERTCFLPNGPKTSWWVNLLLRGVRNNNNVTNPAETAASLLELCRQEGDPTLLTALLEYIGHEVPATFGEVSHIIQGYIDNPPEDEPGAFDMIVLQMLQSYEPHDEDVYDEDGITVERLISMIRHTGHRAFNLFGTNGQATSVHSGKIIVQIRVLTADQNEFPVGTIVIEYEPLYAHGVIAGVQVYNPFERVLFMSQVRKNLNDLLNLPHLLMELLRPDQVGPRIVDYSTTRSKVLEITMRLKEMVEAVEKKISSLQSFSMRIEFFVKYEYNYAWEFENLNHNPCPTSMIDAYQCNELRDYLLNGISEKFRVIEKLVHDDSINAREHRRSNFADNLTHDQIATYVIFSEQLLINLGISNYTGRFTQQMQRRKIVLKERLGAFCIPEDDCVEADEETLERTLLPFTVNCSNFLARPVLTTVHDRNFTLRGRRMESYLIAEAHNLKKRVYLPFLYVQAMERIHCLLVVAGGHQSPNYTPLTMINYDHIACHLPQPQRCILIQELLKELCSVYDYCWFTMVNDKNKAARHGNVTREQFPKKVTEMDQFVEVNQFTYPHVRLKHHSPQYPRVDNEDALYKMCFGNGNESARSWTTFCGSMIARNLESIWKSLMEARIAPLTQPSSDYMADGLQERQYNMFSFEHLKYCFGRQFVEWHAPGIPIVWYTTTGCLRKEVGSACPCIISPHRIPAIMIPLNERRLDNNQFGNTKDKFWQCLNSAYGPYNFSVMILSRVLCQSIVTQHNQGIPPRASQQSIHMTMGEIKIGNENTLNMIYGNRVSAENYIKNHLTKRMLTNMRYLTIVGQDGYANLAFQHKFRLALVAGMAPLTVEYVKSLYDANRGTSIPAEQEINFEFFNTTSHGLIHLNHLLGHAGFHRLGDAVKHACTFGILTQGLLSKVLACRVQYDRNRHVYHRSLSTNNQVQIDFNSIANTQMFHTAGFEISEAYTTIS